VRPKTVARRVDDTAPHGIQALAGQPAALGEADA
jgi:hypothetical protein